MEAIAEKCTECEVLLDEQVECSICKAKACIDCADDSWGHDPRLEHPNHSSGAICPGCVLERFGPSGMPVEEE